MVLYKIYYRYFGNTQYTRRNELNYILNIIKNEYITIKEILLTKQKITHNE